MPGIDEFRHALDDDTRAMIDRLRAIVSASHPLLVDRIKWNAPSFAIDDDDRITLGVQKNGGVRLVLHRGAGTKPASAIPFDDKDGLAKWPAPDRGVIVWKNLAAIDKMADPLGALCRRWVEWASLAG